MLVKWGLGVYLYDYYWWLIERVLCWWIGITEEYVIDDCRLTGELKYNNSDLKGFFPKFFINDLNLWSHGWKLYIVIPPFHVFFLLVVSISRILTTWDTLTWSYRSCPDLACIYRRLMCLYKLYHTRGVDEKDHDGSVVINREEMKYHECTRFYKKNTYKLQVSLSKIFAIYSDLLKAASIMQKTQHGNKD